MRQRLAAMLGMSLLVGGIAGRGGAQAATRESAGAWRHVGVGRFTPMYNAGVPKEGIPVAPFDLATAPVTNARFLAFVTAQPEWRRSRVARVLADTLYLQIGRAHV